MYCQSLIKKEKNIQEKEQIYFENLNEKYLKIKECLARCGNIVFQIEKKKEVEKIINSFLNSRKELNLLCKK